MKREDKNTIIDNLTESIENSKHFYLTDISTLNAESTSKLRRACFEKEIQLVVVKNTLLRKALEKFDTKFEELFGLLKDSTSIMFTEGASIPAKLIKEFRKTSDRPVLKAAYVEESIYIGDDQLDALSNIKSKEELIGDIILLLKSPAQNILSALQSGNTKLAGLVKTLSEKE
ncbi:MAG: 50S ribosomal protein L10 [Bacteroidales bacterium]|nr:50S ribosomal protein L10 [Bacteroidales bacterium]MBN2762458.1 50S ribosomal protein L10 [Bacteroidales bacterium]